MNYKKFLFYFYKKVLFEDINFNKIYFIKNSKKYYVYQFYYLG